MSQRCRNCSHWDLDSATSGQKSKRVNEYRVSACNWQMPKLPPIADSVKVEIKNRGFTAASDGITCPVFAKRV